jgi:hypothetical protein
MQATRSHGSCYSHKRTKQESLGLFARPGLQKNSRLLQACVDSKVGETNEDITTVVFNILQAELGKAPATE